jgi:hypothetical protein
MMGFNFDKLRQKSATMVDDSKFRKEIFDKLQKGHGTKTTSIKTSFFLSLPIESEAEDGQ